MGDGSVRPEIAAYLEARLGELDRIPEARKEGLERIARFVGDARSAGRPARLVFICTHNSRRSHMAQSWAQAAAAYVGIDGIEAFSGGTEVTAFAPRAVAALERAGFRIERTIPGNNPVYEVRYRESGPAIRAFSKLYHERPNPSEEFCAVMTCSHADAGCPVVSGASERVAIPYDDPKASDGTGQETAAWGRFYCVPRRRAARPLPGSISIWEIT